MIYTIQNKKLTVQISDVGAELMSIKANGTEYLWQGNPEYWSGRAYNMFPICGRLTEGKYTYRGKTYEMNLHGFARKTAYTVSEQGEDHISFNLKESEASLKMYPFPFDLTITYTLEGSSVTTHYIVKNTGDDTLIFAVGGHPGFNVPLEDGKAFTDYRLSFAEKAPVQSITMSAACYTTRTEQPFSLRCGRTLALRHDLFDNDAIVLKDISKSVTLTSGSGRAVTVDFPDMNYLGLWHKPCCEAPYVCIEPWVSVPAYDGEIDDLETKRDMIHLEKGGVYTNNMTITVK